MRTKKLHSQCVSLSHITILLDNSLYMVLLRNGVIMRACFRASLGLQNLRLGSGKQIIIFETPCNLFQIPLCWNHAVDLVC